jgi:DHA2 family multidrug resistance protein
MRRWQATSASPRPLISGSLSRVRGKCRGFYPPAVLLQAALASLAGVPVYIMLAKKFDTRWLMMFGLASFGLSMWAFSYITSDWSGGELLVPQAAGNQRPWPADNAIGPCCALGRFE